MYQCINDSLLHDANKIQPACTHVHIRRRTTERQQKEVLTQTVRFSPVLWTATAVIQFTTDQTTAVSQRSELSRLQNCSACDESGGAWKEVVVLVYLHESLGHLPKRTGGEEVLRFCLQSGLELDASWGRVSSYCFATPLMNSKYLFFGSKPRSSIVSWARSTYEKASQIP